MIKLGDAAKGIIDDFWKDPTTGEWARGFGPCRDPKTALAALNFVRSVEAGTAFVRVPPKLDALDGGHAEVIGGGEVSYKSLAGDVYAAMVIKLHSLSLIDIDVIVPGCDKPVRLTKIKFKKEG